MQAKILLLAYNFFLLLQVYETGCQGLLVSAVMDRLVVPSSTTKDQDSSVPESRSKLIHIFQTGSPQTQAVNQMNFSQQQISQHVSSR
jgi:hypothetical protein